MSGPINANVSLDWKSINQYERTKADNLVDLDDPDQQKAKGDLSNDRVVTSQAFREVAAANGKDPTDVNVVLEMFNGDKDNLYSEDEFDKMVKMVNDPHLHDYQSLVQDAYKAAGLPLDGTGHTQWTERAFTLMRQHPDFTPAQLEYALVQEIKAAASQPKPGDGGRR